MDSVDIKALKKDKEFLENLKKLEEEVANSDDIAKVYQLLDVKLTLFSDDEESINNLFQKIVDGSFSLIAQKIENNKNLDLTNPKEWAAARGIYEYAIQRYSENDTKSAQELFLALYHTIEDFEIKEAMMVHAAAIAKGYSLDDFTTKLTKLEDSDFSDPKAVFITNFVQPIDNLLKMFKDEVAVLNARLNKLKKAQEG